MPDEPTPEQWQRTIDTLLATAERCYRLARGIADRQAIEALLKVAEECEAQAEELRNQTRGQGSHHHFRHVESPGRGHVPKVGPVSLAAAEVVLRQ
jgi:hypothetical protein